MHVAGPGVSFSAHQGPVDFSGPAAPNLFFNTQPGMAGCSMCHLLGLQVESKAELSSFLLEISSKNVIGMVLLDMFDIFAV